MTASSAQRPGSVDSGQRAGDPSNGAPALCSSSTAEAELVSAVSRGDSTAFGTLFRQHYAGLCDFVAGYVGSNDAAEDLVQAVFLGVWTRRAAWHPKGSIATYLYKAARNQAFTYLSHRNLARRLEALVDGEEVPGLAAAPVSPDDRLDEAALSNAVSRAVEALPERYRRVLELRSRQGMSYAAIGEVLDMPVRTVETRIARALRALRVALGGFFPTA